MNIRNNFKMNRMILIIMKMIKKIQSFQKKIQHLKI